MQNVKIRAAVTADADAVAALSGELGYPAEGKAMAGRLATLLSTPESDVVLVATVGGEVVGWVHVAVVRSLENDPFAEIRGLVVAETRRGKGVGTQLVEAAETCARVRALPRIRVRSNTLRERAHAFYERIGYSATKQQKVFDKPLPLVDAAPPAER